MVSIRSLIFTFFTYTILSANGNISTPPEIDVAKWEVKKLEDGACKTDLEEYITALQNFGNEDNLWALQMLDSSAKVPNGLLSLNLVHIGVFEECLAVNHPEGHFQGKHCMLTISLNQPTSLAVKLPKIMDIYRMKKEQPMRPHNRQSGDGYAFKFGVCIPSTCSAADINKLIGGNGIINAMEADCWIDEERQLSDLAIAFISVCGVLVLITATSSCYHYMSISRNVKPRRILCAFSIYENLPKLLEIRSIDGDNMGCLHGIRTLSMMWVVLCHTYEHQLTKPLINLITGPEFLASLKHEIITNGFNSVDTFFFLSGLLIAFVFFRNIGRSGTYDALMNYIHRFIRLTPPYAMMVFATVSIFSYTGYGPIWYSTITPEVKACENNWWSALLYVQNYVNPEAQCIGQSWYLAVDMQMFWIAPFILYPVFWWPIYGTIFLGLLTVASSIWTLVIAYEKDYKANVELMTDENQFRYEYIATHMRMMPWLVGVLCGVFICAIKSRNIKIRLNKMVVVFGWCATTALCLGLIFSVHVFQTDTERPAIESALYLSFNRLGWGIALAWIVFACIYGYGGIINTILSLGIWQPMGKLSYAVYLVHETILTYKAATSQTNLLMSDLDAVFEYLAVLVLSYLISFLMYLMIEAPFVILDQEILGGLHILPYPKPKKSQPKNAPVTDQPQGAQDVNKETIDKIA